VSQKLEIARYDEDEASPESTTSFSICHLAYNVALRIAGHTTLILNYGAGMTYLKQDEL